MRPRRRLARRATQERTLASGSPEYFGWTFLNKQYCINNQGDKDRSQFTTGENVVPVVDLDAHHYSVDICPNDPNNHDGAISAAVADQPRGPHHEFSCMPLIVRPDHGAQSIDQFVFRDEAGRCSMYSGGWRH